MSGILTAMEVLRLGAENKLLREQLAEARESERANAEDAIAAAEELHLMRESVRGFALTLRQWAVAAGGHTPSAIVASKLLELVGDQPGEGNVTGTKAGAQ